MKQPGHYRLIFFTLAGIAAFLYLNLFILPGTPVLLSGDQVFFWMFGQRILGGEIPYRDFFQFTPPGTDLAYFAAFKFLGVHVWVTNAVVLGLGVALCWVCFRISRRIMDRNWALLATLLFVSLVYSRLLNATHHLFSVFVVMSAVLVLMSGTDSLKLASTGALLGIASFFTQTHGALALIAFSLFLFIDAGPIERWQNFWKSAGVLWAGFLGVTLCVNAWFLARVGLKQLLYSQAYYVLKVMVHGPETSLLGIPGPAYWQVVPHSSLPYEYAQMLFVYAVLPVSYILAFRRCWKNTGGPAFPRREVLLLAFSGSFLLAELAFSLNWLRLYAVSMPGIILLMWLLSTGRRARRYLMTAVCFAVAGLAVQRVWSTQRHHYQVADLPGGKCATETSAYEQLSWFVQRTKPGDYFFQAVWPGMYIPLGLRNPVFLDTAHTMLNAEWVGRAVRELKAKQVRYVLWSPGLDYGPDPRRPTTAHIAPLRDYVRSAYQRVHVFSDGEEVWQRKQADSSVVGSAKR